MARREDPRAAYSVQLPPDKTNIDAATDMSAGLADDRSDGLGRSFSARSFFLLAYSSMCVSIYRQRPCSPAAASSHCSRYHAVRVCVRA